MFHFQKERAGVSPWAVTALVVVVSIVVCAMAWNRAGQYQAELKACGQNMSSQVAVEKKKAVEDVEEKYRADRISYEVMSRQMARQQNSMREMDAQEK